jgi:hypothetical protein
VVALAAVAVLAGCGDDDEPRATAPAQTVTDPADTPAEQRSLRRARCPVDAPPGCRTATGRVLYVEAVDPDGDGDAHYVLAGGSITAPGVSVIDVAKRLRPRRLPRPGDRVSAAGPVYRGSFGQRQIEALVVNYEER